MKSEIAHRNYKNELNGLKKCIYMQINFIDLINKVEN